MKLEDKRVAVFVDYIGAIGGGERVAFAFAVAGVGSCQAYWRLHAV
jgi:hypothetical protein